MNFREAPIENRNGAFAQAQKNRSEGLMVAPVW